MDINPAITHKWDGKVTHAKRPKVLIVGGGLGGLALGAVLQRSGTPYEIFERATEIKPLGPAISLTASTACLFKQLGIWEEFRALSRELTVIQVVNEELKSEFNVCTADDPVRRYGAEARIIPRPKLYDLLLRQVPRDRIHFGKKILSTQQGGNGVIIRCSDGSEYDGDILVGADGAHSAVRQNLYARLKKEMKLPPPDDESLPFSTVCLVGQTRPLTTEEFPHLAYETSQFVRVLGDNKPYAWSTFTTQQSTVTFSVIQFLNDESSKENDSFRQSEWGAEAVDTMCREVRAFPVVSGRKKTMTLGDLIDLTPKELISKMMLEEKVFETWHHGRTVLIGDGGAGVTNAIHDAIVLANYIHALPDHPVTAQIEECFKAYHEERLPWGFKAKVTRSVMKHMPRWLSVELERRLLSNRPQLNFLPRDDTEATFEPAPQLSLHVKRPISAQQEGSKVAEYATARPV
ncbi:hypothetical protein BG015_007181 [Linnemannia schmuckeri]|uniref:FAD-binding domain-containing protein n=1 Tax=Linnemannia schmuckeri TaxID=64567 RepID=A0A9P5VB24_9FUNG|nr:hypothetical protein BG015_007181 [Linnemannia schmuckeri]